MANLKLKSIPMTEELEIDGEMQPVQQALLLAHDANRTCVSFSRHYQPPTIDLLFRLGDQFFIETRPYFDEDAERVPVTAQLVPVNKAIIEYQERLDRVVPVDIAFPGIEHTSRLEKHRTRHDERMTGIGRSA